MKNYFNNLNRISRSSEKIRSERLYCFAKCVVASLGCLITSLQAQEVVQPTITPPVPAERDELLDQFQPAQLSESHETKAQAMALYAQGLRVEADKGFGEALPVFLEVLDLDPRFVELHIRIALQHIRNNQPDLALAQLLKGLEYSPKSPALQSNAAYCYLLQKQFKEAVRVAQNTLTNFPKEIIAWQTLYESLVALGRQEDATNCIVNASRMELTDSVFWSQLARMFKDQLAAGGKFDKEAISGLIRPLYQKAISQPSTPAEIYAQYGDFEFFVDNYKQALSFYQKALEIDDESPDILMRVGQLELFFGMTAEAIGHMETAYQVRPEFPQLRRCLADAYLKAGKEEQAVPLCEELTRRYPTHRPYYVFLGRYFDRTNQLEKAEYNYQQALLLQSDNAEAYLCLANIQIRRKNWKKAEITLTEAKDKFPKSPHLHLSHAIVLRELHQYAAALEALDRVKSLNTTPTGFPLSSPYYLALSLTYDQTGQTEQAEAALMQGLEKDSQNPQLQNALAYHWAERGIRLKEALEISKKTIAISPENGGFLDTLGWIYFKMGHYNDSLEHLKKAVTLTNEEPEVLSHLAEVHERLEQFKEALSLWQRLATLQPDDAQISARIKSARDAMEKLNASRN